jgi:ribosomal protein S6
VKIESSLNITDEVLRHLLVTVDERKLKAEAKQAVRRAHGAEDEEETEEDK